MKSSQVDVQQLFTLLLIICFICVYYWPGIIACRVFSCDVSGRLVLLLLINSIDLFLLLRSADELGVLPLSACECNEPRVQLLLPHHRHHHRPPWPWPLLHGWQAAVARDPLKAASRAGGSISQTWSLAGPSWSTPCKLSVHGPSVLYTHTHTHTHPFNGRLSGTTRVSRYQKGKTNLDFTEARDSEWQ